MRITTAGPCTCRRAISSTRTRSASNCSADIEDRWNKGKFGKEYEESSNLGEKRKWDKGLGLSGGRRSSKSGGSTTT